MDCIAGYAVTGHQQIPWQIRQFCQRLGQYAIRGKFVALAHHGRNDDPGTVCVQAPAFGELLAVCGTQRGSIPVRAGVQKRRQMHDVCGLTRYPPQPRDVVPRRAEQQRRAMDRLYRRVVSDRPCAARALAGMRRLGDDVGNL